MYSAVAAHLYTLLYKYIIFNEGYCDADAIAFGYCTQNIIKWVSICAFLAFTTQYLSKLLCTQNTNHWKNHFVCNFRLEPENSGFPILMAMMMMIENDYLFVCRWMLLLIFKVIRFFFYFLVWNVEKMFLYSCYWGIKHQQHNTHDT